MAVAIPTEYVPEFNEILGVLTKTEGTMRRTSEELATEILNALVAMRSPAPGVDAVDEPVEPVDDPPKLTAVEDIPPLDMLGWTELRESGLLWLINASVFHPRGVAMAVHNTGDWETPGEDIGWKLIAAGPGEAFSYLQRSPEHPEGVDIDDLFRRSEAFIESVRGQDPTHYLDADPVGYVPPEDGAVYINDDGQGTRFCARCNVWFEVQDVLDQSEHVHIDR